MTFEAVEPTFPRHAAPRRASRFSTAFHYVSSRPRARYFVVLLGYCIDLPDTLNRTLAGVALFNTCILDRNVYLSVSATTEKCRDATRSRDGEGRTSARGQRYIVRLQGMSSLLLRRKLLFLTGVEWTSWEQIPESRFRPAFVISLRRRLLNDYGFINRPIVLILCVFFVQEIHWSRRRWITGRECGSV